MLLLEVRDMTKSTVTRTWIGGLVVLAIGFIIVGVSVGLMLAYGGTFTPAPDGNSYDFVPQYDGFFATTVVLIVIGGITVAVGGLVQLAAWVGALVNTYKLQDKTWFGVLLALGLLGFAFGLLGFAAMVAYLIAGPDGTTAPTPQIPTETPRTSTLAPTS
jgi:hypothetical protein